MAHEPVPSTGPWPRASARASPRGNGGIAVASGGGADLRGPLSRSKGGIASVFPQDRPAAQRLSHCHSLRGPWITSDWSDFRPLPVPHRRKRPQAATLTGDELKDQVAKIDWGKHVKDDRATHEVELRPNQTGTVLVPEAAPVVVRTEATVPAATSLETAAFPCFACPRASPVRIAGDPGEILARWIARVSRGSEARRRCTST